MKKKKFNVTFYTHPIHVHTISMPSDYDFNFLNFVFDERVTGIFFLECVNVSTVRLG